MVILSGVSQRQTSHGPAYMWNLKKKDTDEFIYKTKQKTTATENKVMVTKGRAGRG